MKYLPNPLMLEDSDWLKRVLVGLQFSKMGMDQRLDSGYSLDWSWEFLVLIS